MDLKYLKNSVMTITQIQEMAEVQHVKSKLIMCVLVGIHIMHLMYALTVTIVKGCM